MKMKKDDLVSKMAFGELDSQEEEMLRQELEKDSPLNSEYGSYVEIRDGLKKLSSSVPSCQYSVERMRDAILNQNLKESKRDSYRWTWLWAPIGAGVLALIFLSNNANTSDSPIASQGSNVAWSDSLKPDPISESIDRATKVNPLSPDGSITDATPEIQPSGNTVRPKQNYIIRAYNSNKQSGRTSGYRGVERPLSLPHNDSKAITKTISSDPPKQEDAIVLVDSNTDDVTGTQNAKEVDSVANVVIGG